MLAIRDASVISASSRAAQTTRAGSRYLTSTMEEDCDLGVRPATSRIRNTRLENHALTKKAPARAEAFDAEIDRLLISARC